MLAFHDDSQQVPLLTTWELRLTDGAFTVRAKDAKLTVSAGAPEQADLVVTAADDQLHRLLTRQLSPAEAVASGAITVDGDEAALAQLVELFEFPALG